MTIATTDRAWRVLETSHPPTYYVPPAAFLDGVLRAAAGSSWCEWKGMASYYDLVTDARVAERAGWTYLEPTRGFEPIAGAIAVMAAQVDRCTVNGEQVATATGRLLRRLDHQLGQGPVQGHSGIQGLVTAPDVRTCERSGRRTSSGARRWRAPTRAAVRRSC